MLYAAVILDPNSLSAPHRITSLLDSGHQFKRVFFYKNGVAACLVPHVTAWTAIARNHNVELTCCVGSLERRNIRIPDNSGFSIGGLGLLAECFVECDEVIQFGG